MSQLVDKGPTSVTNPRKLLDPHSEADDF